MAKGDHSRMQNQVNYQTANNQNHIDNLRKDSVTPLGQNMYNNYLGGAERNQGDYDAIMGGYRNLLGSGDGSTPGMASGGGMALPSKLNYDPAYRQWVDKSLAGYEDFSKTGGYSDENIADIRSRAIAPTRAVYANAQRNMDRSKAIQGGYAPNYIAAQAKTARDLSQSMSDANTNANAAIASDVRQGKQFGIAGMGSLGSSQQQFEFQKALAELNAKQEAARAANAGSSANAANANATTLAALRGMTDIYGTNPAMMAVTGNQAIGQQGNMIDVERLQLQNSGQALQGQNQVSGTPGNYQAALGNVGGTLALGGQIAGGLSGIDAMFGGYNGPTGYVNNDVNNVQNQIYGSGSGKYTTSWR
jgi:hypothetical protein